MVKGLVLMIIWFPSRLADAPQSGVCSGDKAGFLEAARLAGGRTMGTDMGVFVTREHVRHNKSGIAHRGRTRMYH
jgi:hypothetical protein